MVIEKEYELDIEFKKIECLIKEVLRRKRKVKVNDKIKIIFKKDLNFGGILYFLIMLSWIVINYFFENMFLNFWVRIWF